MVQRTVRRRTKPPHLGRTHRQGGVGSEELAREHKALTVVRCNYIANTQGCTYESLREVSLAGSKAVHTGDASCHGEGLPEIDGVWARQNHAF
jgi:hypothetical protein